jgi:hypothetical protein
MSLKTRVGKIESGLDVAMLSGEQQRMLDIRKLSVAQLRALDVLQLTDEQLWQIDFRVLTVAQIDALSSTCDEATRAWLESLSDEELRVAAEGRLSPWWPWYRGE